MLKLTCRGNPIWFNSNYVVAVIKEYPSSSRPYTSIYTVAVESAFGVDETAEEVVRMIEEANSV